MNEEFQRLEQKAKIDSLANRFAAFTSMTYNKAAKEVIQWSKRFPKK